MSGPLTLRAVLTRPIVGLLLLGALAACSAGGPTGSSGSGSSGPDLSVLRKPLPGISLPADPLRSLVPAPDEVPPGMVPILTGSGARGAAAIAGYSADSAQAATALAAHGFTSAYVAQYADPSSARVLSVVVVRFATPAGATADLAGDLAASSGDVLNLATVGDRSQARRQPLPGASGGELVTLRFRQGATTWLLAYGDRPTADPSIALALARLLVARA